MATGGGNSCVPCLSNQIITVVKDPAGAVFACRLHKSLLPDTQLIHSRGGTTYSLTSGHMVCNEVSSYVKPCNQAKVPSLI